MAFLNWRNVRWISISIAVLTAVFLFGIAESIFGMTLEDEFVVASVKILLAIGNAFSAYLLWKVL